MFKSRFSLGLFILLLLFAALVIFQSKINMIAGSKDLPATIEKELAALGAKALTTNDVPVGALLVYNDQIIGKGFNTVNSDSNLAGHAEINAMNNAVREMGLDRFNRLDRSNLVLYTTFEPCEMCRGTMIHYNITNVRYVKSKSLLHWWKVQLKGIRYEFNKRMTGDEQLQDSLFMLHPDYPGRNKENP